MFDHTFKNSSETRNYFFAYFQEALCYFLLVYVSWTRFAYTYIFIIILKRSSIKKKQAKTILFFSHVHTNFTKTISLDLRFCLYSFVCFRCEIKCRLIFNLVYCHKINILLFYMNSFIHQESRHSTPICGHCSKKKRRTD